MLNSEYAIKTNNYHIIMINSAYSIRGSYRTILL